MDEDSNKQGTELEPSYPSSGSQSGGPVPANYLNYPCFNENEFIDNGDVQEQEQSMVDDEDVLDGVVADNFVIPSERRRLVSKKDAQKRYAEARKNALDKTKIKKKVITIDVDSDANEGTVKEGIVNEDNLDELDLQKNLFSGESDEEEPLPLEEFVVDDGYHYEGYKGVSSPIQKLFAPKYNERTGPPQLPSHKRKIQQLVDEEVSLSPPKRRRRVSTDACNTPLITNFLTKEPIKTPIQKPTPKSPMPIFTPAPSLPVPHPTPTSTSKVATISAPPTAPSEDVVRLWKRPWRAPAVAAASTSPPTSIFRTRTSVRPPLPSQPTTTPTRVLYFPDFNENSLSAPDLPIPCVIPTKDYIPPTPILPEATSLPTPTTPAPTPTPTHSSTESPSPQTLLSPSIPQSNPYSTPSPSSKTIASILPPNLGSETTSLQPTPPPSQNIASNLPNPVSDMHPSLQPTPPPSSKIIDSNPPNPASVTHPSLQPTPPPSSQIVASNLPNPVSATPPSLQPTLPTLPPPPSQIVSSNLPNPASVTHPSLQPTLPPSQIVASNLPNAISVTPPSLQPTLPPPSLQPTLPPPSLQPTKCSFPDSSIPLPNTPSAATIPSKRWRVHVFTNLDRKLLILIDPNKTIQDLAKEIEFRFSKIKPDSKCSVVSIELKDGFQLSDDYLIHEITTDSAELMAILSET